VIDVLLAVYNGAKTLPRQLESLKNQTEPVHILWQDDGSTDGSCQLLKDEEQVNLPHTKGVTGNFMSLLAASKGEYAMFCDQDDVWHPDKAAKTLAKMREGETLYGKETPLLVHTDLRVTNGEGIELHPSLFAHQGWDPAANTLNRLLVQNNVTGCTVMVNRPLRELLLKANPDQMVLHDWWAALTAAAFGHILFVNEPTMDYCQHGQNQVGASRQGILARAAKALTAWQKGKERINLTYTHGASFLSCYEKELSCTAKETLENYLEIPKKPKLSRLSALRRGGYTMQNSITRIGHDVFV